MTTQVATAQVQNMIASFLGCPSDQAIRSLTNIVTTCPQDESEFWQAVLKGYFAAVDNA